MTATQTAESHTRADCADCGQTDPGCQTCHGCFICDSEGYAGCEDCDGTGYVDNDSDRYCRTCTGRTYTDCPRGCPKI